MVNKLKEEINANNNYGYNNENIIDNKEPNKWLIQKGNNCRYNAFITLFYFTNTPFFKKIIIIYY